MNNFKNIHFEIASEAVSGHKYHPSDLPVCSFHVRRKLVIAQLIAHGYVVASSLGGLGTRLARGFYQGPSKFYPDQARVGSGVITPLLRARCTSIHMYMHACAYRSPQYKQALTAPRCSKTKRDSCRG